MIEQSHAVQAAFCLARHRPDGLMASNLTKSTYCFLEFLESQLTRSSARGKGIHPLTAGASLNMQLGASSQTSGS